MHDLRPSFAVHPLRFGRAGVRVHECNLPSVTKGEGGSTLAADIRLFAVTFLAGFLFVTILIS